MVLQVHRADGAVLLVALWVLMAASGCAPAPTAGPAPEAARVKADKVDFIDASLYCETSVDMFCSYYVRCGRMAVADLAECRTTFLQACNARFEPYYADLARRGWLRLSATGLASCRKHLDAVACDAQVGDLEGCGGVWVGTVPVGGACGAGLDSFVCAPNAVCTLDARLCGRCVARAARGETCDASRACSWDDVCSYGLCVPRAGVGEACDPMLAGACIGDTVCTNGVCVRETVVKVGETCDAERRCPYRSSCVQGVCVRTALRGETCSETVGCASGWCRDGRCEAFRAVGESCENAHSCTSRRCEDGQCAEIVWSCMQSDGAVP
jgi:hypothetical protein